MLLYSLGSKEYFLCISYFFLIKEECWVFPIPLVFMFPFPPPPNDRSYCFMFFMFPFPPNDRSYSQGRRRSERGGRLIPLCYSWIGVAPYEEWTGSSPNDPFTVWGQMIPLCLRPKYPISWVSNDHRMRSERGSLPNDVTRPKWGQMIPSPYEGKWSHFLGLIWIPEGDEQSPLAPHWHKNFKHKHL